MRAAIGPLLLLAACSFDPRGTSQAPADAADATVEDDAADLDAAADVDAAVIDAPATDAAVIDAAVIDAAVIDAPPIDAPPIDAPAIDAPAACPGYVAVTGTPAASRYRRVRAYTRWPTAEADCESDGGYLMIPDSDAEATAIVDWVAPDSTSPFIWVGVSDVDRNNVWTTVLGATFSPTWGPGQPNNTGGDDYLIITRTPRYYDWGGTQFYACECDGRTVP